MKTCKKILAVILVLVLMMNMFTFVFADEAATNKLLWGSNFNGLTVGSILNSGKTYLADEGTWKDNVGDSSKLYAKGASSNKVNTTTVVLDSSDNTNKYIYTSHNQLGYNVRNNPENFTNYGYDVKANSVYSTSYDIMIPEKTIEGANNAGYKNRRYAAVTFGTTSTSYSDMAGCAYVNIYNGKISGYATKGTSTTSARITEKYSKEIDYTYDRWVTLRIDCWIVDTKARVAVYADNELIYVGDRDDVTVSGIAANTTEFRYANIADGTALNSWPAATGNADNQSYTYYDNFKVSLLTSDNEVNAEYYQTFIFLTKH